MDDVLTTLPQVVDLGATRERIWLLGQPQLENYLRFVRHRVVGGHLIDKRTLVDEWREANDYYHELEEREAGLADDNEVVDLPSELGTLAEAVADDYRFRASFSALPTTFAMVEIDRLVVSQLQVTRQFVDALADRLGPSPDAAGLFRFCLPLDRDEASIRVQRVGRRRYVFSSESTDLRSHEPTLLQAQQLAEFTSFGPVGGMVGLAVGFGSNFLNAIRADDRLILSNGYHRACALRALGVTHAPCIVQHVTRRDELNLVATKAVTDEPAFYCTAGRPPLLKDFFDPRIRKILRMRPQRKMVEVKFKITEFHVDE